LKARVDVLELCGKEPHLGLISHASAVPLPKPQDVKLRDVTHSTMNVIWEPVLGKVRKYIVRYKTPEEDFKEVS
jgi:collagen type XII alpha